MRTCDWDWQGKRSPCSKPAAATIWGGAVCRIHLSALIKRYGAEARLSYSPYKPRIPKPNPPKPAPPTAAQLERADRVRAIFFRLIITSAQAAALKPVPE